jgi:hypothetical protein
VIALCASGCALGPKALDNNRLKYNQVLAKTEDEELLLNLVRLRYRDTPMFLPTGSIATQHEWDYSAQVSGDFVTRGMGPAGELGDVLHFFAGAAGAERPTVTYVPTGGDLLRGLASPLSSETLFILGYSGWGIDRTLRLVANSMNDLGNAISAAGPDLSGSPEYEEFLWLVTNLKILEQRGGIEVGRDTKPQIASTPIPKESVTPSDFQAAHTAGYEYQPTPDGEHLLLSKPEPASFLQIAPDELTSPEVAEVTKFLKLKPGLRRYEFDVSLEGQLAPDIVEPEGTSLINVSIRSPLEMMFFLSYAVDVPTEHIVCGLASQGVDCEGTPLCCQPLFHGLFRVHVAKHKPKQAAVCVKYRDHWFYIADDDPDSKLTLFLLGEIVSLQVQLGGAENLPVLTLGVGS